MESFVHVISSKVIIQFLNKNPRYNNMNITELRLLVNGSYNLVWLITFKNFIEEFQIQFLTDGMGEYLYNIDIRNPHFVRR